MKQINQSPELRKFFNQGIQKKQDSRANQIRQQFGDHPIGDFVAQAHQIKTLQNQWQGNAGENFVAFLFQRLPNTWVMGRNIFIPTTQKNEQKLTW